MLEQVRKDFEVRSSLVSESWGLGLCFWVLGLRFSKTLIGSNWRRGEREGR